MRERRDALCGAAEFALAVEASALAEVENETVATTVAVECLPGAMNVVPGEATLLVDIRGIDGASMHRVLASISERGRRIAESRGLRLELETLSVGVPTRLREDVVTRVAAAARAAGFDPLLLPSGAGHDAQCLADTADVGMIFVPSVNGVSHSAAEFTTDVDVEAGARALAAAWFDLASAAVPP
jgi:acetylornithine deacetylase/succinyl-diaminopimelate desuccinylase-like protein